MPVVMAVVPGTPPVVGSLAQTPTTGPPPSSPPPGAMPPPPTLKEFPFDPADPPKPNIGGVDDHFG